MSVVVAAALTLPARSTWVKLKERLPALALVVLWKVRPRSMACTSAAVKMPPLDLLKVKVLVTAE